MRQATRHLNESNRIMAGHSKWSNIKRRKKAQDKKRNKIFNKHMREISVAAKEGGGDPDANPRLKMAIENAKEDNVPKDNIEKAIKKGTGELVEGEGRYEDATYEAYGPGGIAYFIEVTTNNYNRTVGEIRNILHNHGGNLGTDGSVDYLFEQKGMIKIPSEGLDEEDFMLEAIDAGAEDIKEEDGFFEVYTEREELFEVRNNLEDAGYNIKNAKLVRIPMTEIEVDRETALSNLKLMDELDNSDDVSNIFTNMKMDEQAVKAAEEL